MAAYALNRLKPKYARSSKGAVFHQFDTSSAQAEAEILSAVVNAINVIGSHPNHPAGAPQS
jgi:competence protein ComFB